MTRVVPGFPDVRLEAWQKSVPCRVDHRMEGVTSVKRIATDKKYSGRLVRTCVILSSWLRRHFRPPWANDNQQLRPEKSGCYSLRGDPLGRYWLRFAKLASEPSGRA
jgi:hypothetical protein